jgi:NADH:ubiquinone oxidoreductase subunit F (NADH-binding)
MSHQVSPTRDGAPAVPASLPRLLAQLGRPLLADHLDHWGRLPRGGPLLIDEILRSGLVGRGGASFPTGRKWAAVASRKRVAVVANGTEGEPASSKDKTLLTYAPHLVLDGAVLAAETLGATEAIICVDQAASDVCQAVRYALAERVLADLDTVTVRLEAVPPGYVTGEESAVVNWLNTGTAKPTFGFRPFEKGVKGRPTLVNNVETLANVALIARFGAEWHRRIGTRTSPGSALVTISGDVARPAIYEIALGSRLVDVIGPSMPTSSPQAVLIGGYSGTWLPASTIPTVRIEEVSLRQIGASMGCGSIVVVGEDSCGLKGAASITSWMAGQSATQCGPCVNGLPAIADAMRRIAVGDEPTRLTAQVDRWMWMVEGRGACKHPDGVIRMVRSALGVFASEVSQHRSTGPCRRPIPPLPLPRYNNT